jgi:pimeloyl-ACP methyl ester carboxylesterase
MGLGFPRGGATSDPVDKLQISGALMAPSDGPSPVELADAGHAPHGLGVIRDQYMRKVRKTPTIRMVPGSMRVEGRLLQYAVSDNVAAHGPDGPDSPPIWAVNIHGYFAGGGMYWRESARLAEQLGWRVINPSLPGFGGSDPLDWHDVSMEMLANQIMAVLHQVEAGPVVVLGHSMGGAVAVQFAHDHPRHTLGLIYRDGVSTPAWKVRHGVVSTVVAPFAPNVAPLVDLAAAVVSDLPDLFIGRMFSTVRSVLPDVRRNVRTAGQTLPIGSLLMSIDQRSEVRALVAQEMPILTEWGCFDRITPGAAAAEFAGAARAAVQWVPGGHSWMLARPQGQSDILTHLAAGKEFMARIESRWRQLTARDHILHAVNEWG